MNTTPSLPGSTGNNPTPPSLPFAPGVQQPTDAERAKVQAKWTPEAAREAFKLVGEVLKAHPEIVDEWLRIALAKVK